MERRPWEREITPVLVAYNSAAILPWSLAPLATCQHLIVVDNNSQDTTCEVVRKCAEQAQIIKTGKNLGFGRANNLALDFVETPFALLINPDAKLRKGALEAIWKAAMRYPDAAILAPIFSTGSVSNKHPFMQEPRRRRKRHHSFQKAISASTLQPAQP